MRFVYGFGFETSAQRANNEASGWDDEDSAALLIEAESDEEAREWGRAVADAFVKWLYESPDESWANAGYADYVEEETVSRWTRDDLRNLQTVAVGQMSDLTSISAHRAPVRR